MYLLNFAFECTNVIHESKNKIKNVFSQPVDQRVPFGRCFWWKYPPLFIYCENSNFSRYFAIHRFHLIRISEYVLWYRVLEWLCNHNSFDPWTNQSQRQATYCFYDCLYYTVRFAVPSALTTTITFRMLYKNESQTHSIVFAKESTAKK